MALPTKRLTREAQKALTRERLLEAAKKVFAKNGYAQASIEAIAEEAGFTVGAVYSNFDGKDDLFTELIKKHTEEQLEATRKLVEAADAVPEARIREAIKSLLDHMTEEKGDLWLLSFEFWRSSLGDARLRKKFLEYNRQLIENTTKLLISQLEILGIESQTPPEKVARALFMLTDGFMLYRLIDHPDFDDELFEEAVNKLMTSLVLAPEVEQAYS